MSGRYLLAIHIGPVQEFIAAARRTADLWAGSQLLLDVVGAAAAVFPDDDRIFPRDARRGGANRILTFVTGDPSVELEKAKVAASKALERAWHDCLNSLTQPQRDALDLKRAAAQVHDFLTVVGAWVPVGSADDYPAARKRVEQLLRGRKATRDFRQGALDDAGVPKSPLDPSLPTIRRHGASELAERPLFLKSTESLDAISVIKRVRGATRGGRVLSTRALAERSRKPDATDDGHASQDPETNEAVPDYPYFAVVVADGDGMGNLLDRLAAESFEPAAEHIRVGGLLDRFAHDAESEIATVGQRVYCGGDDVLALLPVTKVLSVAEKLAELFAETLEATLSAGIAIVHYRDPLSVSLARAREAESTAKRHKDAVCLTVHTRGGSPVSVVRSWRDFTLPVWQQAYQEGHIPRGVPFELANLAAGWHPSLAGDVLANEAERILMHKPDLDDTTRNSLVTRIKANLAGSASPADQLRDMARELGIARFLSVAEEAN